ncbi:MAG: hypothetical protein WCS59_04935, partial [Sphaerochaetaceae bacterium]
VLMEQGVAGGALLESNNTVIHNKLALLDASFGHLANIEQMHSTLHSKYKDPRRQEMRRKKLLANWPELADQIRSQLYSYEEVATLLTKAGCPVRSQDIGLDKNKAVTTLRKAQLIRNRYTVLDALDDLGLMENVIQIISSDTRFF